MESIAQLVAESQARHGFHRPVDPRRLQWSRWFRCDSPLSLLHIPSQPGFVALAEEVTPAHVGTGALACPAERSSAAAPRMLTLLQFTSSDNMAFTLDRLFTQPQPMRARLSSGRCFLRFVVLEDPTERRNLYAVLSRSLVPSAVTASGMPADFDAFCFENGAASGTRAAEELA